MSETAYQKLFDKQSQLYSLYRPQYPQELFDFINKLLETKELAWDVGTGSGQAALMLANSFEKVLASDSSESQISQASPHPRITYRVAAADESGLDDQSCNLITVASAIHWFALQAFYKECKRVLKPDGVLAAWCYTWLIVPAELKQPIDDFYKEIEAFWAAPLALVRSEYRDLEFPFAEIEAPKFTLQGSWTLEQLLGFYSSWSGVQTHREMTGKDAVQTLAETLKSIGPEDTIEIKLPLHLRVGRHQ